jgi:hypothetical protein
MSWPLKLYLSIKQEIINLTLKILSCLPLFQYLYRFGELHRSSFFIHSLEFFWIDLLYMYNHKFVGFHFQKGMVYRAYLH